MLKKSHLMRRAWSLLRQSMVRYSRPAFAACAALRTRLCGFSALAERPTTRNTPKFQTHFQSGDHEMMPVCEVTSLTEQVEAALSSDACKEDKDRRVLDIEAAIAHMTPTSASGALYQALLLREAADLLHSWAPDSGEGAEICQRYARMADALGAGVVSFLRSVGGSLPAEVEAYHSFE